MYLRKYLLFGLACGIVSGPFGGTLASEPLYTARIELETRNHSLIVKPYCQSSIDASLHYRLSTIKIGRSGTSRSAQSGSIRLKAGLPRILAHLRLGISKLDRYSIELELFHDGRRVASDRVTYSGVI